MWNPIKAIREIWREETPEPVSTITEKPNPLEELGISKGEYEFIKLLRTASTEEKIDLILGKSSPSFQHFIAGMKKVYVDNKNAQRNSWKWLDDIEHRRNACTMLADDATPERILQAAVYCYYALFTKQTQKKDMINTEDLKRISNTWKTWQPKSIYSSTSKQPETVEVPTTMLSKSEPNSDIKEKQ